MLRFGGQFLLLITHSRIPATGLLAWIAYTPWRAAATPLSNLRMPSENGKGQSKNERKDSQ
jgi:hypothetical protein